MRLRCAAGTVGCGSHADDWRRPQQRLRWEGNERPAVARREILTAGRHGGTATGSAACGRAGGALARGDTFGLGLLAGTILEHDFYLVDNAAAFGARLVD